MDATGKNISNDKISPHTLLCHYSWNVWGKFYENWSNLNTLQIHTEQMYSSQNQMQDFSSQRFANNLCHAMRLSRLLKLQTNGMTGPPGVNNNGSRFPGKGNP